MQREGKSTPASTMMLVNACHRYKLFNCQYQVDTVVEAEATITLEVPWLLLLKVHYCSLNIPCHCLLYAPRTICRRLTSSSINYSKLSTRTRTKLQLPV